MSFFRNPVGAVTALTLSTEATKRMEALIEQRRLRAHSIQDGEADAFRHALWSYLMTKRLGADAAKRFGDAREISFPGDASQQLMDLYNNRIGRLLALDPRNDGRPPEEVVYEALRSGRLQAAPFFVR